MDNNSAEDLGAIGGLLILRADTRWVSPYKECLAYCNNLGTICHAEKPNTPLPEEQSQGDVIILVEQYIRELVFDVPYHHIQSVTNKQCVQFLMSIRMNLVQCGLFLRSRPNKY